jgi:CopG family transcriptional regulator, nickel-responsive regulator
MMLSEFPARIAVPPRAPACIAMSKDKIARFGVSLSRSLLKELDRMVREKGYRNRSLAISDMVRDHLVGHQQELGDSEVAGTITLVYDHHRSHVQDALTGLQHKHLGTIISALHVHLDHDNCLEVLVVRGKASVVKSVAEHLIAVRGVKHGKLTLTTTGKDLPE